MSEPNKKRPGPQAAKTLQKVSVDTLTDPEAKKTLPTLLDVLLPIYRDGTMTRQAGRMTISPDGSSWRVAIDCPTEGLQCVLMIDSLQTLLADCEKLLASGVVRWGQSWSRRKKSLPVIDDLIQ